VSSVRVSSVLAPLSQLEALPDHIFRDGNRGYSVGVGFETGWGDVADLQIATNAWAQSHDNDTFVLQPGHVFHVRAFTRDLGRAAAAVSETVAVTESGCDVLTAYPRSRAPIVV